MKRVYIEWYDSYTWDGWDKPEEAIKLCTPLMLCKTVGYILNEDKDHITICHTYNPSMVMGSLHIPKGCIKRLKRFV
jgi:hypothetical protein